MNVVFLAALLTLGLCASARATGGEVYKFRDADGVIHVTSVAADRSKATGKVQTISVPRAVLRSSPAPAGSGATSPTGAAAARGATRTVVTTMYVVKHPSGAIEYTNLRPRGGYLRSFAVVTGGLAADPASRIDWNHVGLNTDAYAAEVDAAAALHGIDRALVRAIMHAESAFQRNALSPKGAQGLMQLMPATAGDYGVTDAFDPGQNVTAGVEHLAMLLKLYAGDVTLAAAAYNAGQGAVARHGNQVPPFAETQVYVQRVNTLHQRYRDQLAVSTPVAAERPVASRGAAP